MCYENFIRDCIDRDLPLDEMMKEEIRYIIYSYKFDKAIDIMVNNFIPSLHHEANKIKEKYEENGFY